MARNTLTFRLKCPPKVTDMMDRGHPPDLFSLVRQTSSLSALDTCVQKDGVAFRILDHLEQTEISRRRLLMSDMCSDVISTESKSTIDESMSIISSGGKEWIEAEGV